MSAGASGTDVEEIGPAAPPTGGWRTWAWRLAGPVFALLMFVLALSALHRLLHEHHLRDIFAAAGRIPSAQLGWAALLTLLAYLTLTGYDALAMLYIRRPIPYPRIAVASFVSYAFSMNLGFAPLTGSAVRFRVYSGWGLSAIDVAKVVAFSGIAFWLGFLALAGAFFLIEPATLPGVVRLPLGSTQAIGVAFLLIVAAVLVWGGWMHRPIRIHQWELHTPSTAISLLGIGVSCADWALAAGVLYVLLPGSVPHGYPGFLTTFMLAQLVGVASTVPGGLGVFESAMVLLLRDHLETPPLVGALLVFRAVYFLAPFGAATLALGAAEIHRHRALVRHVAARWDDWIAPVVPHVLAVTTFVAGVILLFSGATPALAERLHLVRHVLPLGVVELSHLAGSLLGVLLLILARSVQRRVRAAFTMVALLLSLGIVASLAKGGDYEEALALGIILAALLASRGEFHRRARLLSPSLTPGWVILIALAVATTIWLGIASFRHIEYSHSLWWHFSDQGDAARFLRSSMGVALVLLGFALVRARRRDRARFAVQADADLDRAAAIAARGTESSGCGALLRDRRLLFDDDRSAFIQFGIHGRSWIALGDPVGPESRQRELVWRFAELCDEYGGWTVFHDVPAASLPLYIEVGLSPMVIGERARVPLREFAQGDGQVRELRRSVQGLERLGCTFAVIPCDQVPGLLPALRRVSEAWLREPGRRELGFFGGRFDESCLSRYPIAVVRRGADLVAFASLWATELRHELSADVVRWPPHAPPGVMDYLLAQLMLWGGQEGYEWFDLGLTPLADLEGHPLAQVWRRVGPAIFRYGEHFAGDPELRAYKERFAAVWEPRHIVYPGGLILADILLDLEALAAGGAGRNVAAAANPA